MLTLAERLQFLQTAPIFQEIRDTALLEQLATAVDEQTFPPSYEIVNQGETSGLLYMIVSGRVQVHAGASVLAHLQTNDFFGEMSIFSATPPTASVKALEPCHCLLLTQDQLYSAIDTAPAIAMNIIRILCHRIHNMNRSIPALIPTLER